MKIWNEIDAAKMNALLVLKRQADLQGQVLSQDWVFAVVICRLRDTGSRWRDKLQMSSDHTTDISPHDIDQTLESIISKRALSQFGHWSDFGKQLFCHPDIRYTWSILLHQRINISVTEIKNHLHLLTGFGLTVDKYIKPSCIITVVSAVIF